MSHWTEAALVKEWRYAFRILAKEAKIPCLDKVQITAQPYVRHRRSQDLAACYPAAKAAIDGFADSCLVDDSPAHVTKLTFLPPVLGAEKDALVLMIEEDRG